VEMHVDIKAEPQFNEDFDVDFDQNKLMKEEITEDNFVNEDPLKHKVNNTV
jgi:hypothetical protein